MRIRPLVLQKEPQQVPQSAKTTSTVTLHRSSPVSKYRVTFHIHAKRIHGLGGSIAYPVSEVPDRLSDKSIQSAPNRRKPASIPRIARQQFVTKRDEDSSKSISLGIEPCCLDRRLIALLGFASMFLSLAAANSYRHVRTRKLGLGA